MDRSDQGLLCLLRLICPNYSNYGKIPGETLSINTHCFDKCFLLAQAGQDIDG